MNPDTSFLPSPLRRFLSLYEDELYFEAHEVLEASWLRNRSHFYRGLIILAAAFCQRNRGNERGTARNLRKARTYLARFPGSHLGFWVPDLVREIDRRLLALRNVGIDGEPLRSAEVPGQSPRALQRWVPHLPLHPRRRHVRGGELEWGEGVQD